MAKIKLNIMMEEGMKDYVEEQAERLGISQSGFINVCIAYYREQREAVQSMAQFKDVVFQLEKLQKGTKK